MEKNHPLKGDKRILNSIAAIDAEMLELIIRFKELSALKTQLEKKPQLSIVK